MIKIQLRLSKQTDADLISFFSQQNEKAATLVLAALCSYIQGTEINTKLLPTTIVEQSKPMQVCIRVKTDRVRKNKKTDYINVKQIEQYLNEIPVGFAQLYIKGILRHIYGAVIYQSGYEIPQQTHSLSCVSYELKELPEIPLASVQQEEPSVVDTDTEEDDDIFSMFEALLDD